LVAPFRRASHRSGRWVGAALADTCAKWRLVALTLDLSDGVVSSGRSESIVESVTLGRRRFLEGRWTADVKLSHSVKQRFSLHSQSLRSAITATHYPIARFKRPDYVISLNFLETRHWNVGRMEGFQLGGWGTQYGERGKNDSRAASFTRRAERSRFHA
jgi:hypothetical protein